MHHHGGDWSWAALIALGVFHGINPAMGWLFAVALGMQERSRSAVWRSLLPLGLGHAVAIAAAILASMALGALIPMQRLRLPVAVVLMTFGVYQFFRHKHPRWAGMAVGFTRLATWSFLMATAHGAGLMIIPVFLAMAFPETPQSSMGAFAATAATLVHTAAYLLTTAVAAVVVFEKLGLGLLRKAWVNLDAIWAAALVTAGLFTVLLP